MAAGAASATGKIGFVAPYPIPSHPGGRRVHNGRTADEPEGTVKVVWTNTWFGPATERTAAQALVALVLTCWPTARTARRLAKWQSPWLKWTGYDSNQETFAPRPG